MCHHACRHWLVCTGRSATAVHVWFLAVQLFQLVPVLLACSSNWHCKVGAESLAATMAHLVTLMRLCVASSAQAAGLLLALFNPGPAPLQHMHKMRPVYIAACLGVAHRKRPLTEPFFRTAPPLCCAHFCTPLLTPFLQLLTASCFHVPAGRTAFEALNCNLPQGTTGLIQSSSSSTPGSRVSPSEVLAWVHTIPGHGDLLDQAILAHQGAADKQDRG
jgi:hypothetical protein